MSARHLLFCASVVTGSIFLAGCASQRRLGCDVIADPHAPVAVASSSWTAGKELYVRMNRDLGPTTSPAGTRFTATVLEPMSDPHGKVLVPVGSLVLGRVVSVDPERHRIEVIFDGLRTRSSVYPLEARLLAIWPYALNVRPDGDLSLAHTVVLERADSATGSAIGGGPKAADADQETSVDRVVPFDAELRLQVVAPLIPSAPIARD